MPLHDTYFAEPLRELFDSLAAGKPAFDGEPSAESFRGSEISVELFGVLKAGRTQLRLRVAEVAKAATAAGAGLMSIAATAIGRQPSSGPFGRRTQADASGTAGGANRVDAALFEALSSVGVSRAVVDS